MKDHLKIDYDVARLLKFDEKGNKYYLLSCRNEFGYLSITKIQPKEKKKYLFYPEEKEKEK